MAEKWSPYIEAQMLKGMYEQSAHQHTFNLLLLGGKGTGKTSILRTARKPVHIDSFDKGGTKVLQDEIDKGNIVVDSRWEIEDQLSPTAFELWKREFEIRRLRGYFNAIGTYALDSSTYWGEAIMNWILKLEGRTGEVPRWNHEYIKQKSQMSQYIDWMLNLPCDVVVTGHLQERYDNSKPDEPKFLGYEYFIVGKNKVLVPGKFDEMYISMRSDNNKFELLTQHEQYYKATSRIDRGKFSRREPPDIKALLKKIGWDTKDKPSLFTLPKEEVQE